MFHPSVTRLIWKEFRTQWQVWVALIVGAFLLQSLFLVRGSAFVTIGAFPFYVAITLTYCFAATCGAMLFAGEREAETFVLLRSLPISTGRFVMGKVLFAILSVIAFGAAAAALGAVVWSFDPAPQAYRGFMTGETLLNGLLPGILGCLLWSMFFSLLLSRVMVVIVCAVVTEFAVTGLITNPLSDYAKTEFAIRLGLYAALAAVDLWLMGRWLRNEPFSVPWEGRSIRKPRRDRWSVDLSLATVHWASARHTLGSRTFAVLIWRELKTAVPFILWWGLLGLFMVDVAVRFDLFPGNWLYLLSTPVVCGCMTCLGDQRRQVYRFLGERGLSGPTVWLSKHVVWLAVAFGLIVLFSWYDAFFQHRFPQFYHDGRDDRSLIEAIRQSFSQGPLQSITATQSIPRLQMTFVIAVGLSFYAVGHACSLWLKRSVVSVATAGIVAVAMLAWIVTAIRFDVPLLIAVGPFVVGILIGTLTMTGAWLRSDSSWWHLCKQMAWVILPAIVTLSGTLVYRATQIPDVGPGFDWQAWEERPVASPQWMSKWNRDLDRIAQSASEMPFLDAEVEHPDPMGDFGPVFGTPHPTPLSEEERDELFQKIREELVSASAELEQMLDEQKFPPPLDMRLAGPTRQRVDPFLDGARVLLSRGDLSGAWQVLRTSLRVSTYAAQSNSVYSFLFTCLNQQRVLAGMRDWANDENQTVEQLEEAIRWFDEHENEKLDHGDGLRNQYVFYRQLLTGQGPSWEKRIENTSSLAAFSSPLYAIERRRMLRLLNVVTHFFVSAESNQTETLGVTPEQIDRWGVSSIIFDDQLNEFLGMTGQVELNAEYVDHHFETNLAARRMTKLVIRLQAYRLREGHFPDRLEDLPGDQIGVLIDDPVMHQPFGYAPQGLELSTEDSERYLLAPHQPVLWSTNRFLLTQFDQGNRSLGQPDDTTTPSLVADPNRIQIASLPTEILFVKRAP